MWQGWEHVVGCEGMWQGVGTCRMGGSRVWGHVAGVWICHRGSGLVHGRRHAAGVGTCGRVWGHVAWVPHIQWQLLQISCSQLQTMSFRRLRFAIHVIYGRINF